MLTTCRNSCTKSNAELTFRKEDEFKITQARLRERDMQIQERMLKFSSFLSDNEQKKKKFDSKIEDE